MYDFISGDITERTPTFVVLETGSIGYFINISLNTYTQLSEHNRCQLYIHQIVREDALILYGFFDKTEREVFRQLISVSGVGANTARLILSSLSPADIERAINEGNVGILQSVKGIGAKSAQRIIVDLKGKIIKGNVATHWMLFVWEIFEIFEPKLYQKIYNWVIKNYKEEGVPKPEVFISKSKYAIKEFYQEIENISDETKKAIKAKAYAETLIFFKAFGMKGTAEKVYDYIIKNNIEY